jgi:hypothetical protein
MQQLPRVEVGDQLPHEGLGHRLGERRLGLGADLRHGPFAVEAADDRQQRLGHEGRLAETQPTDQDDAGRGTLPGALHFERAERRPVEVGRRRCHGAE